jgi:hypothetical protein
MYRVDTAQQDATISEYMNVLYADLNSGKARYWTTGASFANNDLHHWRHPSFRYWRRNRRWLLHMELHGPR